MTAGGASPDRTLIAVYSLVCLSVGAAIVALCLLLNAGGVSAPATVVHAATPTPIAGRLTVISRSGNTYTADAQWGGADYSGPSLKTVGEGAMYDLDNAGGGTIRFQAGTFDFGQDYFAIHSVSNVEFAGQGIDVTFIQNNTNANADTEPFNVSIGNGLVVRDMTVSAGGTPRTTSDALDFDSVNNSTVERVKVTASRARGIIFDGKGAGQESNNNTIRDCVVNGTQSHGIELLAADNNRIENCTISNVGGHGIQVSKSSPVAVTPNEPSDDNVIIGTTIQNAASDGVSVLSGNRNRILDNDASGNGRDGLRVHSSDGFPCDDNFVYGNTANNNLAWGLQVLSPLCHDTVAGVNMLTGNSQGAFNDEGTETISAPPPYDSDYDNDTHPNSTDNCPAAPNATQKDTDADGAGDHCDPGDSDLDGYPDESEARYIGTKADDACDVDWPSNLYNATPSVNAVTIEDLTSYLGPDRRLDTSPGDGAYNRRWDLIPGRGVFLETINIQDLSALFSGTSGYPPMLDGWPAYGSPCAY
jgi:parallel beta-helix repeat protein